MSFIEVTVKLYHYSDKQHSELLTRRVQGADEKEIDIATFKAKRMGLPLPYHDHISLFFEPIPAEHIASTFLNGHPFWKAGNEIYEHVIDIQDIDPTSFWRVVESIEQNEFSDQFDWDNVSDLSIRGGWFTRMHQNDAKLGLLGYDVRLIYKAMRQVMVMSTLDFYRAASFRRDPENAQYAANVPHLMIYPIGGIIPVSSVKKIKLGNAKAEPVLFHLSFRKLPATLIPRQPEDSGDEPTEFTEQLPARVSFSPTIHQAFGAIYPNISKFFEVDNLKSIKLNVYSTINGATLPQIPNDNVKSKVWDAHYTGEVCFTAPVKVTLVGVVEIFNPYTDKRNRKDIEVHPFDNPMLPIQFLCPIVKLKFIPTSKNSIMY